MTPIGSIIYWPSQLMPTGYLLCDGREVAINDYPELYAAIGNIGGDDVASGNFRLPDMRGVVAGGYHSGLPNSNPLHGNFGDQVGNPTHTHTQGKTGAASGNTGSTTLTVSQIPSHKHVLRGRYGGGGANGYGLITNSGDAITGNSSGTTDNCKNVSSAMDNTGGGSGHTHTLNSHTHTNPTTNSSSSVQPTKLYNWVIKAKHVTQLGGTVSGDFEVKGKLIMPEDKYASSGGAINMRNSDIVNANGIYMNDESEGHEGINFLKQGASSGSTNQDDYENLRGYRGKLYYNENPVVDSGSNSNGRWTKWMDGTMICYKHINFGDVVITTAWGSFYETASDYSCGNYPQAFVETPCISIMPINTCFVEKRGNTTATSWGSFWACRPAQYESFSLVVDCIAIGRWK